MCIAFWKKKKYVASDASKPFRPEENVELENESESIIVEPLETTEPVENKKKIIQKYHVSQNKNKDANSYLKWRVRKESSDKTIQFFDTQKLAIDHAQELARQAKTTVVIHKLDGSIRKQDYSNKV